MIFIVLFFHAMFSILLLFVMILFVILLMMMSLTLALFLYARLLKLLWIRFGVWGVGLRGGVILWIIEVLFVGGLASLLSSCLMLLNLQEFKLSQIRFELKVQQTFQATEFSKSYTLRLSVLNKIHSYFFAIWLISQITD